MQTTKIPRPAAGLLCFYLLGAFGSASLALGQPASAEGAASSAPTDQIVQMSQFDVTTTQGAGYMATNAASALKTNEPIMSIPQQIIIVTKDLIDDVGLINSADMIRYFGGQQGTFEGETQRIRGMSVSYGRMDDFLFNAFALDPAMIDSYAIVKGPAQFLYPNAPAGGVVLRTTVNPLPYRQDAFTAQVNSWGQIRATLDATGPLGTVGNAKIGYRVVAAAQGGGYWAENDKDTRKVLFTSWDVHLKQTTVRVKWGYAQIYNRGTETALLQPTGPTGYFAHLYVPIGGRKNVNEPPNGIVENETLWYSASILQKISDNWESRFSALVMNYNIFGPLAVPSAVNWATHTETFTPRIDNEPLDTWGAAFDVHGHYNLGPLPNQDSFGFQYTDYVVYNFITSFGTTAITGVDFTNAASVNALRIPGLAAYGPPPSRGSRSENIYADIYESHSVDLIPNWLTAVAGWTWVYTPASSVANMSLLPWQATYVPNQAFTHRLAVVFHPLKEVSIYALDITALYPNSVSNLILVNGVLTLPPLQHAHNVEFGIKTNFLGGKVSTDLAFFREPVSNLLVAGQTLSNGFTVSNPTGQTVDQGFDGDITLNLLDGWQLISTFYKGHARDVNNNPVGSTVDNSWSVFTRYSLPATSGWHGFSFGGGASREGNMWVAVTAISGTPTPANGIMKVEQRIWAEAFLNYEFNRHWKFSVRCDNVLDGIFTIGPSGSNQNDPIYPRTWFFSGSYKF